MKNLQGDIIAIVNASGTKVVEYTYDAWGKLLSKTGSMASTLGALNPFRYRGYVYDEETGLYYLRSRYYDPVWGRFVNADEIKNLGADGTLLSYNLYCNCLNNQINRIDSNGRWSIWATIGAAVGITLCVAAVTILTCGVGTATIAGAVAVGAAKGTLIGAAVGTVAGAGIGYQASGTIEGMIEGAAIGFGAGAMVGAVTGAAYSATQYGTFSTKAKLDEHFIKHGKEFGEMYSNTTEYAKGAKYVNKNGTYIPEKNAYIRFIGVNGKANYAFVGMKAGGHVSTYHVASVSKLVKEGVTMFLN